MPDDALNNFKLYPRMTHWFSPVLLAKLLNNVATSSMFGQYADRRLMVAALDAVEPNEQMRRAQAIKNELKPDEEGAVWIDSSPIFDGLIGLRRFVGF